MYVYGGLIYGLVTREPAGRPAGQNNFILISRLQRSMGATQLFDFNSYRLLVFLNS
jgi:hypothetical protein